MSYPVSTSIAVLDGFSGRLNWIPCRPHGNTFDHALRCEQGLPFSVSQRIGKFCAEHFGPQGPGGRWVMRHEYVAFRMEADMMMFLLQWQGQI